VGQKAKYRREMDKAIAQYGQELRKLTPLESPGTIKTNAYRTATEVADNQLSGADRRALKQSDRLARTINRDDVFKERMAKYNDRLSILQAQLAGESVNRFYVSDTPSIPESSGSSGLLGFSPPLASTPSMATVGAGVSLPDTSYRQDREYFTSREDALAAAQAQADAYNAKQASLPRQPLAQAPRKATAQDFIASQSFGAAPDVQGGDRSIRFGRLDAAAKDMQTLADGIKGTAAEAAATQYSALAERLNAKLGKISATPVEAQSTGLIGSELANELDTGVLK